MLTATRAATIQNKGPRKIRLANAGDGLAGFFLPLNPFNLGILIFFFGATYLHHFLKAGMGA